MALSPKYTPGLASYKGNSGKKRQRQSCPFPKGKRPLSAEILGWGLLVRPRHLPQPHGLTPSPSLGPDTWNLTPPLAGRGHPLTHFIRCPPELSSEAAQCHQGTAHTQIV